MHWFRFITAFTVFSAVVVFSTKLLGKVTLDETMSTEEQKKTGIDQLTDDQKQELENWINEKFVLKQTETTSSVSYLEQNRNNGAELVFRDGSIYEVYPADRSKTNFWMTPLPVTIEPSGDSYYPYKITNTLTQVSVKAKQITPPR